MQDYKGYRMIKITPKDIVIRDSKGERVVIEGRLPKTYKEAKSIIDNIIVEIK